MFKEKYNNALQLYKEGDYDKALFKINQSLIVKPTNYSALHLKGLILRKKGDLKGSLINYNLAIENCPNIEKKEKLEQVKKEIDNLINDDNVEDLIDFDHNQQYD